MVREFDELLNELSDRYIVIDGPAFYRNDHVLYWQFRLSEAFNNMTIGLGGPIDDRYHGLFQRECHSRYRFSQTRAVADVSQHCYVVEPGLAPSTGARSWACHRLPFLLGARYANVYDRPPPTTTREAWIEPLSSDAATAWLRIARRM
jgi:hypothetical protein